MTTAGGQALEGVSATTLWTLHNRASEAKRSDGVIRDPWAVTLFDVISYDYLKFGSPTSRMPCGRKPSIPSHTPIWRPIPGIRGGAGRRPADQLLAAGPRRSGRRIDLVLSRFAPVMALREKLLPHDDRIVPLAQSALDRSWMDRVDNIERCVHHRRGSADVSRTRRCARPDRLLRGPVPRRRR